MRPNPQFSTHLATFTEEILNRKRRYSPLVDSTKK